MTAVMIQTDLRSFEEVQHFPLEEPVTAKLKNVIRDVEFDRIEGEIQGRYHDFPRRFQQKPPRAFYLLKRGGETGLEEARALYKINSLELPDLYDLACFALKFPGAQICHPIAALGAYLTGRPARVAMLRSNIDRHRTLGLSRLDEPFPHFVRFLAVEQ